MEDRQVATVLAWHDALNVSEVEQLVRLSTQDVEVGGPRGSANGAQALREWAERANIRLEPGWTFHRGQTVVVEQRAVWLSPSDGEVVGDETVASVFVVRDGLVASVQRFSDLAAALDAAGLAETDRL